MIFFHTEDQSVAQEVGIPVSAALAVLLTSYVVTVAVIILIDKCQRHKKLKEYQVLHDYSTILFWLS